MVIFGRATFDETKTKKKTDLGNAFKSITFTDLENFIYQREVHVFIKVYEFSNKIIKKKPSKKCHRI